LVLQYRAMYRQAIDPASVQFAGGFGAWSDTAIQESIVGPEGTPPQDVVFSTVWLDLRAEPWWFRIEGIPPGTRAAVRCVDLWGFLADDFAVSASSSRGESLLLAAPIGVKDVPDWIDRIVRGESSFLAVEVETRPDRGSGTDSVTPSRPQISVAPMSERLGTAAPRPGSKIDWWPWRDGDEATDEFWSCANFALSLVTLSKADRAVLDRIAEIGVAPGTRWSASLFADAVVDAIRQGVDDALGDLMAAAVSTGGQSQSSRVEMDSDYFGRALGVIKGTRGLGF
jgi:hypothetical protein